METVNLFGTRRGRLTQAAVWSMERERFSAQALAGALEVSIPTAISLLRRLEEMKASGVTVVCLLALADGGKPYYDAQMAQRIAGLGIPCFACNPQMLPQLLERAFAGQDLGAFAKEFEKRKK